MFTGKRRDTETVMRRLEGGDWKSTIQVTRWSHTLPQARFWSRAEGAIPSLRLTSTALTRDTSSGETFIPVVQLLELCLWQFYLFRPP
jgi:hypothetical protein